MVVSNKTRLVVEHFFNGGYQGVECLLEDASVAIVCSDMVRG